MDRHNLYIDSWFRKPPKKDKDLNLRIKEDKHAKKSRKSSPKKKSKKRG